MNRLGAIACLLTSLACGFTWQPRAIAAGIHPVERPRPEPEPKDPFSREFVNPGATPPRASRSIEDTRLSPSEVLRLADEIARGRHGRFSTVHEDAEQSAKFDDEDSIADTLRDFTGNVIVLGPMTKTSISLRAWRAIAQRPPSMWSFYEIPNEFAGRALASATRVKWGFGLRADEPASQDALLVEDLLYTPIDGNPVQWNLDGFPHDGTVVYRYTNSPAEYLPFQYRRVRPLGRRDSEPVGMVRLLGCCVYGRPPLRMPVIKQFLENAKLDPFKLQLVSLIADSATANAIRREPMLRNSEQISKFGGGDVQQRLKSIMEGSAGKTLVLLGHIEGDEYVVLDKKGRNAGRIPIEEINTLSLQLNVSLIHLGCESSQAMQAGVPAIGVADKFNSVDMVKRLGAALKSKTVAGFLEGLATPEARVVLDSAAGTANDLVFRMALVDERPRADGVLDTHMVLWLHLRSSSCEGTSASSLHNDVCAQAKVVNYKPVIRGARQ